MKLLAPLLLALFGTWTAYSADVESGPAEVVSCYSSVAAPYVHDFRTNSADSFNSSRPFSGERLIIDSSEIGSRRGAIEKFTTVRGIRFALSVHSADSTHIAGEMVISTSSNFSVKREVHLSKENDKAELIISPYVRSLDGSDQLTETKFSCYFYGNSKVSTDQ